MPKRSKIDLKRINGQDYNLLISYLLLCFLLVVTTKAKAQIIIQNQQTKKEVLYFNSTSLQMKEQLPIENYEIYELKGSLAKLNNIQDELEVEIYLDGDKKQIQFTQANPLSEELHISTSQQKNITFETPDFYIGKIHDDHSAIVGLMITQKSFFEIYDRWGSIIFEA